MILRRKFKRTILITGKPLLMTRKAISARLWSAKNIDTIRSYSRMKSAERRRLIDKIKNRPCMDCGNWFEPCQMDFDHRPGENKTDIVTHMQQRALKVVLEEIKKCDIVCSNCHRLRTFLRRRR